MPHTHTHTHTHTQMQIKVTKKGEEVQRALPLPQITFILGASLFVATHRAELRGD